MGVKEINHIKIMTTMKNLFSIAGILLIAFSLLGCPKDNSKETAEYLAAAECSWNTNYVYENGECKCPDGFYELGDEITDYSCIKKSKGTFLMIGEPDCFCGSEIILNMNVDDDNTSENRGFTLFFNGIDYTSFPIACQYTVMPDGDEIYVNYSADIKCLDDKTYIIEMWGKFNEEKTEMEAEVVFNELIDRQYYTKDTCSFLLRQ